MAKHVQRFNLSDHTLEINTRKFKYEKLDFSDIEDYVMALVGSRDYQYKAIKEIMIYLWGDSYKDITNLAKENWKTKTAIQERFQSEENFLGRLPLPDRLSGVVHMATGTGKSYVMFAVAYLSIVLGKVKRVVVLGPSSTVIEKGLTGKFREYLFGEKGMELKQNLPQKYRNINVNLLDENNPIVDNSIVIENINSIYNKDRNSIGDTLFKDTDEVLVLSDEVHHAYSHLKYAGNGAATVDDGGTGDIRDERLWMKFIREETKIKRHIGFTGTPYNQDEYFCDVIFSYSINEAKKDKVIKLIDPILKTESDDGYVKLTQAQKYEHILKTHYLNATKYSYKNKKGVLLLKPITIFINDKQATAERNTQEFIGVLASYLRDNFIDYENVPESQLREIASEKVICVISKPTDNDYKEKLEKIEEVNPDKPGGKVEFVFAVNKLSEGWDVDNVYQIVPMEERVFNSKLLISQVLGRGLRLPRNVPHASIIQNYPVVTVTNHEKFADHIKELVDAVTLCETRFTSEVFKTAEQERYKNHFVIYNLDYNPVPKIVESKKTESTVQERRLLLSNTKETLGLDVTYLSGEKHFELKRNYYTVDEIASTVAQRFSTIIYETNNFDFGNGFVYDELPEYEEIEEVILFAMKEFGIEGRRLSEQNKKATELYFNQFIPRGRKKQIMTHVEGDIIPISTKNIDSSSARSGDVANHKSVFISEDYLNELDEENLFVINDLTKRNKSKGKQFSIYSLNLQPNDLVREVFEQYRIYAVNPSLFKTPQNLVIVSHDPERDFIINLINNTKYIDAWIKSRDMGFYSLDYEFWKGGKDKTRRSFNPDFFIKIDLSSYIKRLEEENSKHIDKLYNLQDQGIKEIICVVEIKSDDDHEEVTRAKEKAGQEHFSSLNERLANINDFNLPHEFRSNTSQHYIFELLRPEFYNRWFANLKVGNLKIL